jgi:hypothetical protein
MDTKSKTQKIKQQSWKQKWLRKSKKLDPEYIKENPSFGIQNYLKPHNNIPLCIVSSIFIQKTEH